MPLTARVIPYHFYSTDINDSYSRICGGKKLKNYTVKNEVCKAHQIVSIHTLFGKKCAYRDISVCMAHFSIYSVKSTKFLFCTITGQKVKVINCEN